MYFVNITEKYKKHELFSSTQNRNLNFTFSDKIDVRNNLHEVTRAFNVLDYCVIKSERVNIVKIVAVSFHSVCVCVCVCVFLCLIIGK